MKAKFGSVLLSLLLLAAFVSPNAFAERPEGDKKGERVGKTTGSPVRTFLNINNISTVIKNDGISDIDYAENNSGLIYPKGSGKAAMFTAGFLWGGFVGNDAQVRVGGTAYRTSLTPGAVINGTAQDPGAADVRIYRVRPDIYPGGPDVDLSAAAADEAVLFPDEATIRANYEKDWTEWPADLGAPYHDGNKNGQYDPVPHEDPELRDIPGVPGADQTIWYVANDFNGVQSRFLYGADPFEMEMQATFWAYAQEGALGNMYFRKYKIINKSDNDFKDMIVSMFCDPDVGDATDDFVGSDTNLSLSFAYNGTANDATYNPLPPPAIGFDFFQGPIVDAPGETAIFEGAYVEDKKNLPMTAFYFFTNGDATVTDPPQGEIEGSTQFYNFFQGRIGQNGDPFVDPISGQQTPFTMPGDPQTGEGWVDGLIYPPADRRMGMASGTFDMAPGDTQEVVVAEIAAGATQGVDRLGAIGLLKFYDQQAQLAYDNFFDLPTPPTEPDVKIVELDQSILLDWSWNDVRIEDTENEAKKGFEFQGYNVYQLPTQGASKSDGRLIATYDVNDGVGKIADYYFDPVTGVVLNGPVQFGTDSGIKRFIEITDDAFRGNQPLVNGNRYYFAVTAYSYNDEDVVPNNLENPLVIRTCVPHSTDPGETLSGEVGDTITTTHTGTADARVDVTIVDPRALTGHQYEVFFDDQVYYRDKDGIWQKANADSSIPPAKPGDVSPSTMEIVAVWGVPNETGTNVDLVCDIDFSSPNGAWADGVELTFPTGVTINGASTVSDCANGATLTPAISGQTVMWGSNDTTGYGCFNGAQMLKVNVGDISGLLPVAIDYTIYDDGYGSPIFDTAATIPYANATGTATISEVGHQYDYKKYWNLRDVTTGEVKLEDRTDVNGVDIYTGEEIGVDAMPIVDGFQVNLNFNFASPITFLSIEQTAGTGEWVFSGGMPWDITDYYTPYGWSATARAIDALGAGTTDVNELQKDYEFRFTGEYEATGADSVMRIKDGTGSIATIYDAREYDIANHPDNPNPGTAAPFQIRIPFEVWNIDDNQQVNLLVYHRIGTPAAKPFYVWNPFGRMYTYVLNTPYDETAPINLADPAVLGAFTWNHVFWGTNHGASEWQKGDVIKVTYTNPVQLGSDVFTFTPVAPDYSVADAKADVKNVNVYPNPYYAVNSEEINKYNRFVTFSHLPRKATIRIFNLAGIQVREIEKDNDSQFQRWDLANEGGLPVASGLYIAYIDMPDLDETKILKLAIVQEQQILDRF